MQKKVEMTLRKGVRVQNYMRSSDPTPLDIDIGRGQILLIAKIKGDAAETGKRCYEPDIRHAEIQLLGFESSAPIDTTTFETLRPLWPVCLHLQQPKTFALHGH
jgi:hypothetical protein